MPPVAAHGRRGIVGARPRAGVVGGGRKARLLSRRPARRNPPRRAPGGGWLLPVHRAALLAATACLLPLSLDRAPAATPAPGSPPRRPPASHPVRVPGDVIQAIKVEGNQRIEEGTILSYMLVAPGDR